MRTMVPMFQAALMIVMTLVASKAPAAPLFVMAPMPTMASTPLMAHMAFKIFMPLMLLVALMVPERPTCLT